jgi:hypothetical protein
MQRVGCDLIELLAIIKGVDYEGEYYQIMKLEAKRRRRGSSVDP